MANPYNVKPPKCRDCGASQPRVVGVTEPGVLTATALVTHVWLCASCEYKRANPGAAPAIKMPGERRPLKLQSEALF